MNSTVSFSRDIPLYDGYDVIVAGGGPAGCAAAAAAAGQGAKTLLLEASGCLGGMGTIGLVPAWCPFSDGEKILYRGIAQQVFEKTKAQMPGVSSDALDWVSIDPEVLKRVYDDLVTDAGCDILFHTSVTDLAHTNGHIDYVVTSNKAGLAAYRAAVYVDCTGDADLVARAGGAFEYGDENQTVQPVTHCFQLSNVNEEAYRRGPGLHALLKDCPVYDIVCSEKYPLVTDGHSCNSTIGPGVVGFNAGHMWDVHGTDPANLSQALIQGRRLAHQFHQGLREFYPSAFGESFLSATAPAMGIRESRRIVGDYTITLEDYFARRDFPDEIGRNCYFIDVHQSLEERERNLRGEFDTEDRFRRYEPGESHGIPYRSLLPQGLQNLLTAGRNVSCDQMVQGSIRVMPPALVTGEAAGTAAALAALTGSDTRSIDTERLREKLRQAGAWFH